MSSGAKLLLGRHCAANWYHPSSLKRVVSWVMLTARLVGATGSWKIDAFCVDGALEGLFGAIGVRIDSSASPQAMEVVRVAFCVLCLVTFASR